MGKRKRPQRAGSATRWTAQARAVGQVIQHGTGRDSGLCGRVQPQRAIGRAQAQQQGTALAEVSRQQAVVQRLQLCRHGQAELRGAIVHRQQLGGDRRTARILRGAGQDLGSHRARAFDRRVMAGHQPCGAGRIEMRHDVRARRMRHQCEDCGQGLVVGRRIDDYPRCTGDARTQVDIGVGVRLGSHETHVVGHRVFGHALGHQHHAFVVGGGVGQQQLQQAYRGRALPADQDGVPAQLRVGHLAHVVAPPEGDEHAAGLGQHRGEQRHRARHQHARGDIAPGHRARRQVAIADGGGGGHVVVRKRVQADELVLTGQDEQHPAQPHVRQQGQRHHAPAHAAHVAPQDPVQPSDDDHGASCAGGAVSCRCAEPAARRGPGRSAARCRWRCRARAERPAS